MVDGKFEWKLNHMLAVVDFLNRYGAKTSLTDLLDFDEKKSLGQILNMDKADFRGALLDGKRGRGKSSGKKPVVKETKQVDYKAEAESLIQDITEIVKDNRLYKKSKISVGVRINGKDINFQKEIKF